MLSERLPLTTVPESVGAFVDDVLPTLSSLGKRTVWCVQWREHPDAVIRLAAIADVGGGKRPAQRTPICTPSCATCPTTTYRGWSTPRAEHSPCAATATRPPSQSRP
jgi:hypothetical protein